MPTTTEEISLFDAQKDFMSAHRKISTQVFLNHYLFTLLYVLCVLVDLPDGKIIESEPNQAFETKHLRSKNRLLAIGPRRWAE